MLWPVPRQERSGYRQEMGNSFQVYDDDTDSFLMSLRRFVARRGTPFELLSDCGTNFRGGEHELKASFEAMCEELQTKMAKHQIRFQFNPPNAPHFGGAWEREVRSIKAALYVTLGAQTVTEEVLQTVLIEVEGILNSKPLGYVSTDVADVDPVTPRRVTKTIRSVDGKVRTAEVQVDERTYTRPVAKLIELPAIPEDASTTAPGDS